MSMTLDGKNLVDPRSVIEYYQSYGLSTELLRKCNSQQFRYIDGYGEGWFLLTSDQVITTKSVTLHIQDTLVPADTIDVTVQVLNHITLEAPSHSDPHLYIIHTGEPKTVLTYVAVTKNYNIINKRTLNGIHADIIDIDGHPIDNPLTLQEIIEDFCADPVNYEGDVLIPYNVFIQGMTQLEATDYLCSAHGLLWTYSDGEVYIFAGADITSGSSGDDLHSPLNDIHESLLISSPLNAILVTYPILNCHLQTPDTFHTDVWTSEEEGRPLHTYNPFFPALYDIDGGIINQDGIDCISSLIRDNMQSIAFYESNYYVKDFHDLLSLSLVPHYLAVTWGDFGSGPKSIFHPIHYPYLPVPSGCTCDNQARNFLGTLTEGYDEVVDGFWVLPTIGLDGRLPEEEQSDFTFIVVPVYVENIYEWDFGLPGFLVRVEWDCVNHRWIPLQQKYICPVGSSSDIDETGPPSPVEGTEDFNVCP